MGWGVKGDLAFDFWKQLIGRQSSWKGGILASTPVSWFKGIYTDQLL
jgi:hypothetical protein